MTDPARPIYEHVAVLDAVVGCCIILIGGLVLRAKKQTCTLKTLPPTEQPGVALVEMPEVLVHNKI